MSTAEFINDAATHTQDWTVHTYPTWMYPHMERPISLLFTDVALAPNCPASLDLSPDQALALARALERAAWKRKCIRNP